MCLITKQSQSKIATKDITCYKVLLKLENTINNIVFYVSPVRHFTYFHNNPDPNEVFKAEKAYWFENYPCDDLKPSYIDDEGVVNPQPVSYELNSGFFHMYKDYDSAIKSIEKTGKIVKEYEKDVKTVKIETEPSVIFECVIPKGSRYYEGVTSVHSFPSIASDKLKIIKQL